MHKFKRVMLFETARKVLGHDIQSGKQGSIVNTTTFAGKHLAEYLEHEEIPEDLKVVKKSEKIKTVEELADALDNDCVAVISSDQLFEMLPDGDGFHHPKGHGNHVFVVVGTDSHPKYGLYFILLDSSKDFHGQLHDFETGEELPEGCLRVRWGAISEMLKDPNGECYAFSA